MRGLLAACFGSSGVPMSMALSIASVRFAVAVAGLSITSTLYTIDARPCQMGVGLSLACQDAAAGSVAPAMVSRSGLFAVRWRHQSDRACVDAFISTARARRSFAWIDD